MIVCDTLEYFGKHTSNEIVRLLLMSLNKKRMSSGIQILNLSAILKVLKASVYSLKENLNFL